MKKLDDVFSIKYGGHDFLGIENAEKGQTPVIKSQGTNNGVCGLFNIVPKYKDVISVSRTGSFCEAFYHDYPCYITDDCMVLTPKNEMSKNEIFWYIYLINKNKYRFSYGRKVTPSRLGDIIMPDKIPDYVNNNKSVEIFSALPSLSKIKNNLKLNDRLWNYIKIENLLDTKKAHVIHKEFLEESMMGNLLKRSIPYIARTQFNNGVVDYVIDDNNYMHYKHKENCLIIGGESVISFYQEHPFYCGNNITILRSEKLNKYNALFLKTIIDNEIRDKFNYGRAASKARLEKLKIKLPATPDGQPDWQFMEDYIKSLPYSASL